MAASLSQSSFKAKNPTKERVVKFANGTQRNNAIALFDINNLSFAYLEGDKYLITIKHCKLLKSKEIGFKVVEYR